MSGRAITISARIDGDLVAIDVTLDDKDYRGVLNTVYLDAEAAVRFGEGLARLGRQINGVLPRSKIDVKMPPGAAIPKTLPLAVHRDPHAEDQR